MPLQETRYLVGWLDEQEAVTQLLGHIPNANEDTSAQRDVWIATTRAVAARNEFNTGVPQLGALPDELQERGRELLAREDVVAAFQGFDITVGVVDLRNVLSFQKFVATEGAARIQDLQSGDWGALFDVCLPNPTTAINIQGTVDSGGHGLSFASTNPNLRVIHSANALVNGQPYFGFSVGFGVPYLQVVEYQGRWFIRDGYHRSYALLRAGINQVPCLFIRAADAAQFGGAEQRFLRWEIIFGPRPPYLVDFLDDQVSKACQRPLTAKVIRLTAQEFHVQI